MNGPTPGFALAIAALLFAPALPAAPQGTAQWPPLRVGPVPTAASDTFSALFPSRVKTFVKASFDPDDRPEAASQGNDDGFSGQNLCEAYRDVDQGNPLAVLAHFEGRAGALGLFFRNFWSDSGGLPFFPGEHNRTRIWLDGTLAYDMPLTDYFRRQDDPRGQISPFAGPFTGGRSGGHYTHAKLRWNQSFRLGAWDDAFHNAARFHRVAVILASPEGELPVSDGGAWDDIVSNPGAWPHETPRQPQITTLQVPAGGFGEIVLTGPATILELTCEVPRHADWLGMRARFFWDGQTQPAVDVPLRLLGGMVAPPYTYPMESLLFGNDGDRRIRCYLPMHFAQGARLQFHNQNAGHVALKVTLAGGRGAHPVPWGHLHAIYHAGTTQTGVPFQGPRLTDARGLLRVLLLEDLMDTTGRIPDQHTTHLEGDLCIRINGQRGDDHTFDASETGIGRWGWYLTPADRPFVSDTSFQTGLLLRGLPKGHVEARRLMGSTFLFDPVHFVAGIDIVLEHGVQNTSNADYGLVSMLYLEPGAARRMIQEIDVGNTAAEQGYGVQFTQWSRYQRQGSFLRDQFFGTPPVTDWVRHVRDFYRFRVDRPNEGQTTAPVAVGFRLDRLGGASLKVCQADVLVDGVPAGLLHVFNHNPVYPWKEGGETEVELPRALTDGKASFVVELRPRAGTDPLKLARVWTYEYSK